MFNMQKMMQQVQKMQQQADKLQQELDAMTITGKSGGGLVEVDVTGQTRFKAIRIKAEAINPDNPQSVSQDTIEMLEDLITSAINEANKEAAGIAKEKMKAITSGLNIPGFGGDALGGGFGGLSNFLG